MSIERVLVSIVIPSRNGRERLVRTLDSARRLAFDLSALEVVVEDDGSTDGTYEALSVRRYPFRFSIGRGEHRNQSAATNAAIARSSGKYVLCAAADLVFDEQLVAQHLEAHRSFAAEPVGVLGYLPYLPELNERPFMFYLMHGGPQFAYTAIRDPRRIAPNFCYAPNFSIEREVLERVGGFDPLFRYGGQDTDLGYRLAFAGVRLVYRAEAIAWHDHPVTLEDYFRRQEAAGISSVLLEQRYPDLEGGAPLWDAALSRYLCYPWAMLDRDLHLVELLEPLVARAHPHYQPLWVEVCSTKTRRLATLDAAERQLLETVETLFAAYDRLVRFHWGKAFFEEAIRSHGTAHVAAKVRERFVKWQTTVQFRRVAERKAAAHGIELELYVAADALDSLVLHDVGSYRDALNGLAPYYSPHDGVYARQIVLAVAEGRLSGAELERLAELAEVVSCRRPEEGLLRAFGQTHGEFVAVRSIQADAKDLPRARWIAQRLFSRIDRLAVLGAGRDEPGSAKPGELQPVDVPSADCVLRGSFARELARDGESLVDPAARGWTHALARIVAQRGGLICQVPELSSPAQDTEVAGRGRA